MPFSLTTRSKRTVFASESLSAWRVATAVTVASSVAVIRMAPARFSTAKGRAGSPET
jgi:hypothetical protein